MHVRGGETTRILYTETQYFRSCIAVCVWTADESCGATNGWIRPKPDIQHLSGAIRWHDVRRSAKLFPAVYVFAHARLAALALRAGRRSRALHGTNSFPSVMLAHEDSIKSIVKFVYFALCKCS